MIAMVGVGGGGGGPPDFKRKLKDFWGVSNF